MRTLSNITPAWLMFVFVSLLFSLIVFRLGVKSELLSEDDIIYHYSTLYLENELADGRHGSLHDCYALAGSGIFERLQIICERSGEVSYRYVIGYWGQLLNLERSVGKRFLQGT